MANMDEVQARMQGYGNNNPNTYFGMPMDDQGYTALGRFFNNPQIDARQARQASLAAGDLTVNPEYLGGYAGDTFYSDSMDDPTRALMKNIGQESRITPYPYGNQDISTTPTEIINTNAFLTNQTDNGWQNVKPGPFAINNPKTKTKVNTSPEAQIATVANPKPKGNKKAPKRITKQRAKDTRKLKKAATVDPLNLFGNKSANSYNPFSSKDRAAAKSYNDSVLAARAADVRAADNSYPGRKGAYGYRDVDISGF